MASELTIGLTFGIAMTPAPRVVVEALTEANVHTGTTGPSGFDLKFAVSTDSPLVTTMLPQGFFDPATRVVITANLRGDTHVLMDGVITHQEMAPSNEAGKSILSIKGDDLTRLMDIVDLTGFPYPAMPAELRIALMIAKYSAIYNILPLIMPSVMLDVSNPLEETPTQHGTDLTYIKYLADLVGYTFYLQPGPNAGNSIAYWGPLLRAPIDFLPKPPPIYVDWDSRSNVESLQFSFDGFAATQWVVFLQEPNTHFPIPIPVPNINPISPPLATKMPAPLKIKRMTGLDRYSVLQATAIALATAAAGANVVAGSGSLNVVRYGTILAARTIIEVRGAGITFDGQYFVESVTHSIKPGSYTQNFALSRNALIASRPASAAAAGTQRLPGFAAGAAGSTGGTGEVPPGPDLAAPAAPIAAGRGQPDTAGHVAGLPASPRT